MNLDYVRKFGYAEMYEWKQDYNDKYYGRFVKFDNDDRSKIVLVDNNSDKNILGVTSINFVTVSNNYDEWHSKYETNEFADTIFEQKDIAYANPEYDQINEFVFMSTHKATTYMPVLNKNFDKNKKYISRIDRKEWVPVVLMGRCLVFDNGSCGPNDNYCQIYNGKDKTLKGTVVPMYDKNLPAYWILRRYSSNTIEILYK